MNKLFLYILLSLVLSVQLYAEKSTQGTEFWVSFFGNENSTASPEFELSIFIAAKDDCTGNITNPITGYTQNFSVTAGLIEKVVVDFSDSYISSVGDTLYKANKGLIVTTSDTVSLYLSNYKNNSADASIVLPTNALGGSYKIGAYPGSATSSFLVIATEDNTQIEFNFNGAIKDEINADVYLAGVNYVKTLDKGQTFLATGTNLIGSTVRSVTCNPIAVFAGDYGDSIPDPNYASSLLVEQISPISTWGKKYLLKEVLSLTFPSKAVIISKEDNTTVTIHKEGLPDEVYIVNKNENKEISVSSGGLFIEADKAIAVTQYVAKAGFGGAPYMLNIIPVEQMLTELTFSGYPDPTGAKILQIFTLTNTSGGVDPIYLDGVDISSSFTLFGANNEYSVYEGNLTDAALRISNEDGFLSYGSGVGFAPPNLTFSYSLGSTTNNIENTYSIKGFDGLSNNPSFSTDIINNIYNPWDTITIDRSVQSDYTSVSWILNGNSLFVPEEAGQAQLSLELPACRLQDGENLLGMIVHRVCPDTIWTNLWLRKALFNLISTDASICEGDSIQLNANTNIPPAEYVWYSKDETLTDNSANPFVDPIITTKYYVYAALDTYHTDIDSLIITVRPKTYATITDTICPSDIYNFYGRSLNVPGVYQQLLFNNLGCDSIVTLDLSHYPQEITYLTDSINHGEYILFASDTLTIKGIYKDTVKNVWNCDSILILDLQVIDDIQPPDVFTPNGDGVNDLFTIKNLYKYPNNKLTVFNRWGNKVYEESPYQNNWNGFNHFGGLMSGNELPVGTYFYILNLGDGSKIKKGYVYLNR